MAEKGSLMDKIWWAITIALFLLFTVGAGCAAIIESKPPLVKDGGQH